MKKIAIFPGSFDPITNGHLDIVERGLQLFDEIIVVISFNENKQTLFSLDERLEQVKQATRQYKRVLVTVHEKGLLVDFAQTLKAKVILRGIRNVADMEYEKTLALLNRHQNNRVETVFIIPSEMQEMISSSAVKTLAQLGGDITRYVPPFIQEALQRKYAH